jgi:TrmH family RNA methyltransferase
LLPAVILVRPTEQGNIGSVARAMANMGLDELVVVDPAAPIGDTARAFAVTAAPILDRLRRVDSLAAALAPYSRLVGTTSTRARVLERPLLTPRELPAVLAADPPGTRVALVFGPESSGLLRDELALCDPLVSIPCAPELPTLNLGQAMLIVAYELHLARVGGVLPQRASAGERHAMATAAEVEGLFEQAAAALRAVGFARDTTFDRVRLDLRYLLARATPTSREVALLRGICRRVVGRFAAGAAAD